MPDMKSQAEAILEAMKRDPHSARQRIEMMERVLERIVVIPGFNRPVGLDAVLSLVPIVGSSAGAVLGAYMLWEGRNLKLSRFQMARMAGNVGIDWLLGLIPFVGVVPDFLFRSNSRNLKIIKRHLDKHHPETRTIEISARPAQKARPPGP